jgi:hypothetical protein
MKKDNMICEQCTFLLDTEEDFLLTSSSDTSQLSPLSGTNTPAQSCDSEQQTDGFPICECGKAMSNCSIHPNTPEAFIAFMQDSLVRTLASLESKQALVRGQDRGFTEKSCVLLASLDPDTSSWKMSQQLPRKVLTKFSKTFPRWGMMQDGCVYAHPMWEHRITEIGGSRCVPDNQTFFHTPNTSGMDGGSNSRRALKNRIFPTPTVNMVSGGGNHNSPTVVAGKYGLNLNGHVQMFPTPAARDWKDNGKSPAELNRNSVTLATHAGGQLNPTWVEWLMGFPIEFTALKDWATRKSRSKLQSRSNSLEDKS